jgi:uncharacterized protein YrrD
MAEAGGGRMTDEVMTDEVKTIRQSDLLNRLVIDRDTREEMGRVEVLWMYPPIHRVLGFVCKAGFLGKKKFAYRLAQIEDLKEDSILVHSQPDATDAERVRLLESLLQYEVWSESGDRIGKITDCLFKRKNGKIIHYLFVSNGLSGILGDLYQLPPSKILSVGENRVVVEASVVPTLHLDREGLVQKLTDVREFVREEAAFEWRSLTRRANRITSGTKERLQDLTQQTQEFTQQTQERTQQFSEEAKAKVKVLDEQLQEFPQTWVDRLRSKSQTVAEQVKQQTQSLSQQLEEGIGTILEQTEDWFGEEKSEEERSGQEERSEGVRSEEERSEEKKEPGSASGWSDAERISVEDEIAQDEIAQDDLERNAQVRKVPDRSETTENATSQRDAAIGGSIDDSLSDSTQDDEWDDEWDDVWGDVWGDSTPSEEKTQNEAKPDRASVSPASVQPPTSPASAAPFREPPAEDPTELEDDDEPWI